MNKIGGNMSIHLKDSNKTSGQDSFKIHSKIAETICEIIENSDLKECSFNMGLFGNWGSGKSFIINKIEKNLPREKYLFLNIDVWKFIGTPLLRSILFDINKQLKEKAKDIFPNGYTENNRELESILYYEERLQKEIPVTFQEIDKKIIHWFKCNKPFTISVFGVIVLIFLCSIFIPNDLIYSLGQWGKILTGLFTANSSLIGIIIGAVGVLFYPLKKLGELIYCGLEVQNYKTLPNFSPEQFERIFSNITNTISENRKKLVIVFDNLDRCEPKYAYETLSTIKTFMDIKNCFYIVPCDDNAVKQYITNNYSIIRNTDELGQKNTFANTLGVEFFDKLFDTYIRIPILEEIDRDKFIEEQLKQITIFEELKDNIREIRQILYYGYKGSTPRQIKKFINDFSTYYLLAKNIDPNKQFLLKNIPFFAIMLVIKQKWSSIENELIQVPQLIQNSEIKDTSFNDFINKIDPLIPQPLPSLLPFIYLKETTNEQFINEKLKNGELIEEFNENIYKRINTELDNIIMSENELYILQAANSSFATLIKSENINNGLKIDFIRTIGKIVSHINDVKNFASFILKNKENLKNFYISINDMYNSEKNIIKSRIVDYLAENQEEYEIYQKELFELIIKDNTKLFKSQDIKPIFSNITSTTEISNSIQNYIQLAFENNKQDFVHSSFIELIINSISTSGIPQNSEICLRSFSANQLSVSNRSLLANKTKELVTYLNSHLQYGTPDITNTIAYIKLCLKLLYKKDFSKEIYPNIMIQLYSILEKLRTTTDTTRKQYAYDILIEMFWFVDEDNKFSSVLNQYTTNNKDLFVERLKTKSFSYIEELFKNELSQKVLLSDVDISNCIYDTFAKEISENYMILLRKDGDIKNLEQLLNCIKEKEITLDKTKFKNDIIQKYIDNNNINIVLDVFKLLNNNGYEVTKKQRLSIKNKLIDFYKEEPQSRILQLGVMKNLLSEDEFNTNILIPIFNFIKSELNSTHQVTNYSNIIQVTNESFINAQLAIVNEIISNLSEDNQEMAEYELCLGLIQLVQNTGHDISIYKEKLEERKTIFNEKLISIYNSLYSQNENKNEVIYET